MKARRLITALGASAVAVVATFALAAPANAASWTIFTTDDNPGGSLSFTANGDQIKVCDTDADGKRAVGDVYDASGKWKYSVFASGNGNCTGVDANDGGVYNLVEGAKYKFSICLESDWHLDGQFCTTVWAYNNN